jgi:hypothetical protein
MAMFFRTGQQAGTRTLPFFQAKNLPHRGIYKKWQCFSAQGNKLGQEHCHFSKLKICRTGEIKKNGNVLAVSLFPCAAPPSLFPLCAFFKKNGYVFVIWLGAIRVRPHKVPPKLYIRMSS